MLLLCYNAQQEEIMLHTIWNHRKTWPALCLILSMALCSFSGCTNQSNHQDKKQESNQIQKQESSLSYTSVTIPIDQHKNRTLVYHPVDNILSQIVRNDNTYTLSTWEEEKGWTSEVKKWKTKEYYTLDLFTYNTNGALYACRKRKKKGKLVEQTLVRLRSNGRIQKVRLTDLNRLSSSASTEQFPEITDIQCCGTSIAITYQYGAVKIYNLAEGQALGASNITGTPGKNAFYDLHYLSLMTQNNTHTILLRDYDIRSGEIARTFPMGGAGQNVEDFYITNYQDDLYVLTYRGLFAGQCSESTLTKTLSYCDLQLPDNSRIVYFQASRDSSLYLGYQTSDEDFQLRLINAPDPVSEELDTKQSRKDPSPAQI